MGLKKPTIPAPFDFSSNDIDAIASEASSENSVTALEISSGWNPRCSRSSARAFDSDKTQKQKSVCSQKKTAAVFEQAGRTKNDLHKGPDLSFRWVLGRAHHGPAESNNVSRTQFVFEPLRGVDKRWFFDNRRHLDDLVAGRKRHDGSSKPTRDATAGFHPFRRTSTFLRNNNNA